MYVGGGAGAYASGFEFCRGGSRGGRLGAGLVLTVGAVVVVVTPGDATEPPVSTRLGGGANSEGSLSDDSGVDSCCRAASRRPSLPEPRPTHPFWPGLVDVSKGYMNRWFTT